jgi:predicted RecB family nuclease
MLITEDVFQAFLNCETKAHLKSMGATSAHPEIIDWHQRLTENYKRVCYAKLRSGLREDECFVGTLSPQDLKSSKHRLIIDCVVQEQGLQSRIHALEQLSFPEKVRQNPLIPVRFIPSEKVAKNDKLLLAFDALVLSALSGKMPPFGKIIHGPNQAAIKIRLDTLVQDVRSLIDRILTQALPPPLVLNRHCVECEFRAQCREAALEKEDLSLLPGLTEKERKQQHNKGIFSVTQLSYTFRPRRKPKRFASKPDKYSHALKALAIREQKIHVAGKPEMKINGNPVYLDAEGIPDRAFYYLIGFRVKNNDSYVQRSFWANDSSEEKKIWFCLLQALAQLDNPQLIHSIYYPHLFRG